MSFTFSWHPTVECFLVGFVFGLGFHIAAAIVSAALSALRGK